jgi:hypothetical protein
MAATGEEQRRAPRYPTRLDAIAGIDGDVLCECTILDINRYGARVDVGDTAPPDQFYLIDVFSGIAHKARVAWRASPMVGTRFLETWVLDDPMSPQWLAEIRRSKLLAIAGERGIMVRRPLAG